MGGNCDHKNTFFTAFTEGVENGRAAGAVSPSPPTFARAASACKNGKTTAEASS